MKKLLRFTFQPVALLSALVALAPPASAALTNAPSNDAVETETVTLPWSVGAIMKPELLRCVEMTAPSNSELRGEILTYATGKTTTAQIEGYLFKDESATLLEAFNKIVRDPSGAVSPTAFTNIRSNGNASLDVIDATQQIFGEREGLQILFLFLRYRINASHFQSKTAAPWYPSELDSLILGLSDLPSHLVPFPLDSHSRKLGYQSAVHSVRDTTVTSAGGGRVLANSAMTFFDSWSEQDELKKRHTVLHEVAHNLQELITDKQNWTNLSPWPAENKYSVMLGGKSVEKIEKLRTTYDSNYVEPQISRYGKSSPGEDFAESVTAYRYRPDWLMERSPEKYAYLKEVIFDEIEYFSEAQCQNAKPAKQVDEAPLRKNFIEFQLAILDEPALNTSDPSLSQKRQECSFQFLSNTTIRNPEESNTLLNKCISAHYAKWFMSRQEYTGLEFPQDTRDIRSVDGTGGFYSPTLNYYTRQKLTDLTRNELRKKILQDFLAFQSTKPPSLRNCTQFAQVFVEWMNTKGEKSALLKSNGWAGRDDLRELEPLFARACTDGMKSRPELQRRWETIVTARPLTHAEFRLGILKWLTEF